jgi:hypothetical protein
MRPRCGGRLVAGFGRALNLSSSHFRDLSGRLGPYNPISKKVLPDHVSPDSGEPGVETWANR